MRADKVVSSGFWFFDGVTGRKFRDPGDILDFVENVYSIEYRLAFEKWLDENYTASQVLDYKDKPFSEYLDEFDTDFIINTEFGKDVEVNDLLFEWFDSDEALRSPDKKSSKSGSKCIKPKSASGVQRIPVKAVTKKTTPKKTSKDLKLAPGKPPVRKPPAKKVAVKMR